MLMEDPYTLDKKFLEKQAKLVSNSVARSCCLQMYQMRFEDVTTLMQQLRGS